MPQHDTPAVAIVVPSPPDVSEACTGAPPPAPPMVVGTPGGTGSHAVRPRTPITAASPSAASGRARPRDRLRSPPVSGRMRCLPPRAVERLEGGDEWGEVP